MLYLGPLWTFLLITACVHAVPYTNIVEDADESIEDTNNPQKFYNTHLESDDWNFYGRRGHSKESKEEPVISDDAIFLAHEKFCQYFYIFDGRDSYLYKCASGYRFDSEQLQCLKTKNVDCGKRKKNVASSEEKKIFNLFKCPKHDGLHPHEHYCHLYFSCQNKKVKLLMCPPGMVFDSENHVCAYRENVNCKKRVYPYDGDDDETEIRDPNEPTYKCDDSSGLYPHPTHCNKFVKCWYGYGDVYVCPHGMLYDVDLMKCRSKSNVYCQDRHDPYGYDDDEPAILVDPYTYYPCPRSKGRFPHPVVCGEFYECVNGVASLYMCPESKFYDAKKQKCRPNEEVNCNRDSGEDQG